jgi:hypothetical protein
MAKFWLSAHCLSNGKIKEIEGEIVSGDPRYVAVSGQWQPWRLNRDCFADRDAAVADARNRQSQKIASLKRQIAKLEKLTWTA